MSNRRPPSDAPDPREHAISELIEAMKRVPEWQDLRPGRRREIASGLVDTQASLMARGYRDDR